MDEKNKDLLKNIKKVRQYAFWFVIVIFTILTIRDIVELTMDYIENPKQSEMKMMVNKSMTMPNITFCMSKKQALYQFKIDSNETKEENDQIIQDELANMADTESFLNKPWDPRLVKEAYEVIATLNSIEREKTVAQSINAIRYFKKALKFAEIRKDAKTWLNIIKERNVTFDQFTQKIGAEILRKSIKQCNRTSDTKHGLFTTKTRTSWISNHSLCFQPEFDGDNYADIISQGQFFILQTTHGIHGNENFDCMTVDFHGRPNGIEKFLDNKGQVKNGITDKLCLGKNYQVNVEVHAAYIMLENDEPETACNIVEDGEDTEFDCRSRCRLEMIKQMCNCIAPTLSYLKRADDEDLPICDYEQCEFDPRGNFTDKVCAKKCLRSCRQIRYEVRVDQESSTTETDMTIVALSWGSFEYLNLEQKYEWSVATFIAALGGAIGLWLGLSILSILQGVAWLVDRCGAKALLEENNEKTAQKAPRGVKTSVFDSSVDKTK